MARLERDYCTRQPRPAQMQFVVVQQDVKHRESLTDLKATSAEKLSVWPARPMGRLATAGKRFKQVHYQRRDTLDWAGGHCGFRASNRCLSCSLSLTGNEKGLKDVHDAQESGVSVGMLEQLKRLWSARKLTDGRRIDQRTAKTIAQSGTSVKHRSMCSCRPSRQHSSFRGHKIEIAMTPHDIICKAVPTAAPIQ